jgi:cytochrome c biogenesis protein CcmG, thiol:disulfide interchange protein DsbE
VKSLRVSIPVLLLLILAGCIGCNDQPHVRMIGSAAPDFTVKDSDRTIRLQDLRGKIVVLNFWTTWCEPCIVEMPSLSRLQKQMGSTVTVLAVSTDDDNDAYHKFLKKYDIQFLTVNDQGKKSAEIYGTTGQPETFIIDSSGVLRRKFIGAVNWTSPEVVDYLQKL